MSKPNLQIVTPFGSYSAGGVRISVDIIELYVIFI